MNKRATGRCGVEEDRLEWDQRETAIAQLLPDVTPVLLLSRLCQETNPTVLHER
jgi:hypothetical protein